jgi:His-Xaa-Ser system protein HxsD
VFPVGEQRTLEVDLRVFSLDTIKRAAYRFTDRFATDLRTSEHTAFCTLIFENRLADDSIDGVMQEFRKELLDQDLRARVGEETQGVRNLILAHAFSGTGLIADDSVPTS